MTYAKIVEMKVLFINSVCGFGSTGRIVETLAQSVEDSLVVFGRKDYTKNLVQTYQMTSFSGNAKAAMKTILFNENGFSNQKETEALIQKIKEFQPDVIHLHNLHGYYLHVGILFDYLKQANIPVVWTLHDCWGFTGYCPHFEKVECDQFQTECKNCLYPFAYPYSLFKQHVNANFLKKKEIFTNVPKMTIVTPSHWLKEVVQTSFLKDYLVEVIPNGIDFTKFSSMPKPSTHFTILYVANVWTEEKGSEEMKQLFPLLNPEIQVKVVGKGSEQFQSFPNVSTFPQTNNIEELVAHYQSAHLLINQTLQDNFPTIHLEALACGTPILTYNTGGCGEVITDKTGIMIPKYDVSEMVNQIHKQFEQYSFQIEDCVTHAKQYSKEEMTSHYHSLYQRI